MTTRFNTGRALRPTTKLLPEHARGHNRSLVLQTVYRVGQQSRADIARETGLTRVTVSDLVAELIAEGLIIETGQREAFQIIGIDLSDHAIFRGAVLDLDGQIVHRAELPLSGATGADATALVIRLAESLVAQSALPILGLGVGSPGVVDLAEACRLSSAPEVLRREIAALEQETA